MTKAVLDGMLAAGFVGGVALLVVAARLNAPNMPGDLANPKLVELWNAQIDNLEQGELSLQQRPGQIPAAAANARLWFGEIHEVVTHCRYSTSQRYNGYEFDLTLNSGEVRKGLRASADRCREEHSTPMRATFEAGRVVEVKTNGAELELPTDNALGDISRTLGALIDLDVELHRERYYYPPPPGLAGEWGP